MKTKENGYFLKAITKANLNVDKLEKNFMTGSKMTSELNKGKLRDFKNILLKLRVSFVELVAITKDESLEVSNDLLKLIKKSLSRVADLEIDETAVNQELKDFVELLYEELKLNLFVLNKGEIQMKDWIHKEELPFVSSDALITIAKTFVSKRKNGVSIFDYQMGTGENLLAFQHHMKAEEVYTYGADDDANKCQIAKDNGVYRVAKEGVRAMTNGTFDISLFVTNRMDFFGNEFYFKNTDEVDRFQSFLWRKSTRGGGYVIFNIPYYRIPNFVDKINGRLKVEAIYRTDDEMGNMIFITTNKKGDVVSQTKVMQAAYLNPKKVAHYSDIEEVFSVNKGDLTLPEMFRPYVIEPKDHLHAFKDKADDFDIIQQIFEPKERVVELNSPLQPYNPGHIPAMATIEITNGIYDTSLHKNLVEDFNYPHISSSKIIQQEVKEEEEEMHKGKLVPTVSLKKRNILVFKTMEIDGTVREILNTK